MISGVLISVLCGFISRHEQLTLMPPLDRTIPLPQRYTFPHLIRKYLHLDMPRMLKPSLQQYLVIAETLGRLPLGRRHFFFEVREGTNHSHSLAAAPVRGFDK